MNIDYSAQGIGEHFKWTFQDVIDFDYIICCKEQHEDGNHHFHIYFEAKKEVRTLNARYFDFNFDGNVYHPNIEKVTKTPWKTVEYVKKDGNFWEYLPENAPTCPFNQLGKSERNKLFRDHDPLELYDQGLLTPTQCERLLRAKKYIARARIENQVRKDKPIVLWFWGSTGSGKTRTAVEMAQDAVGQKYWLSHSEKLLWFDGYCGQEWVIIDDFRRNMCTYYYFLRLLDRHTMSVQVKGDFVNWIPKVIIITSPADPETAYTYFDQRTNEEKKWDDLDQLLRRIDDIICFDDF